MPISPFMAAINQIVDEKGLPKEAVIEAVEAAIAAAYRKDYGHPEDVVRAKFDNETEQWSIAKVYEVVAEDDFESEHCHIQLAEAQEKQPLIAIGDEIVEPLTPHSDFGRIAAQTAKQVIIQRIREAEREILYGEFKEREHKVVTGSVQQIENDTVLINLGKMSAMMLPSDQMASDHYYVGQRLKVFVTGVEETPRGPRVLVSRTHPELIAQLFAQEVPEIQTETVDIKSISREAGSRTKIAVASNQAGIDPVGSCVGGRGARVQAVLSELSGEKIDIILYDDDPVTFITNALSPAKVDHVELFDDTKKALVSVPEDQLSLAIGRAGQNVRLASRLTGWSLDIVATGHEAEKRPDTTTTSTESADDIATPTALDSDTPPAKTETLPSKTKSKKTATLGKTASSSPRKTKT